MKIHNTDFCRALAVKRFHGYITLAVQGSNPYHLGTLDSLRDRGL